ncbi:hypothetical protein V8C42DRAFT_339099 [Trichoderma barbatum]
MASMPGPLPYQRSPNPSVTLGLNTQKPAGRLTPLPLPTEGNEIALACTPRKRKALFDPSLPQLPKMPSKASNNGGVSSSFWSGPKEAATAKTPATEPSSIAMDPKGHTLKETRIQKQIDHIRKIQDTRFETIIAFSTAINECLNGTQGKYNIAAATLIHKALETTLLELIQHDKTSRGNSENPEKSGLENARAQTPHTTKLLQPNLKPDQQQQKLAQTKQNRPTPAGAPAPTSDQGQQRAQKRDLNHCSTVSGHSQEQHKNRQEKQMRRQNPPPGPPRPCMEEDLYHRRQRGFIKTSRLQRRRSHGVQANPDRVRSPTQNERT